MFSSFISYLYRPKIIDVAIAGGTGTLQHFAHGYYMLHALDKLEGFDFRVYLIPLGVDNILSSWIEKYDGWYQQHLHYPMLVCTFI